MTESASKKTEESGVAHVVGVKLFPTLSDDCIEQVVAGDSIKLLFLGIPMGSYTVKDGGLYVAK